MKVVFSLLQDITNTVSDVELKVLLPDRNVVTVTVRKNSTTDQVFDVSTTRFWSGEPGFAYGDQFILEAMRTNCRFFSFSFTVPIQWE